MCVCVFVFKIRRVKTVFVCSCWDFSQRHTPALRVCCVQDDFTVDGVCDARLSSVAFYKVSRCVMPIASKSVPIWKVITCLCLWILYKHTSALASSRPVDRAAAAVRIIKVTEPKGSPEEFWWQRKTQREETATETHRDDRIKAWDGVNSCWRRFTSSHRQDTYPHTHFYSLSESLWLATWNDRKVWRERDCQVDVVYSHLV